MQLLETLRIRAEEFAVHYIRGTLPPNPGLATVCLHTCLSRDSLKRPSSSGNGCLNRMEVS